MIENRKFYRLPSQARFVFGDDKKVLTGKSTNISFGGAFIHTLNIAGINGGDRMKCDFILFDNAPVLSSAIRVKRVVLGSAIPTDFVGPTDYVGVAVEFQDFSGESKRILEEYIFEQKRLYELLGTLLMNTEPDLRSMKPLLSKLPIPKQIELRDLRMFVESTLHSIQLIEQRGV